MIEMTPEQAERLFPELFKLARELRAKGVQVRMHSLRVGEIDSVTGEGGSPVKIVGVPGRAAGT